jgi:hypothetical protein
VIIHPGGTDHSSTLSAARICRRPYGWICRRPALLSCWTARVGEEDRKPVSETSSIVWPIDRTRVPLGKESTMYESNSSGHQLHVPG